MVNLKPDECRVLGVLVEKAQTTPQQYPLTMNGLVLGCNQKNNRHPVVEWDEDRVYNALDSLRTKGLVREANLSGSRVAKYRHVAREALSVETPELVVLAELLMRGPQSAGELRQNASRMHPVESLEAVTVILEGLRKREPAMVRELPRRAGERATRWRQLLCPELHSNEDGGGIGGTAPSEMGVEHRSERSSTTSDNGGADRGLAARVDRLERELETLRDEVRRLAKCGSGVNSQAATGSDA